MKCVLIYILYFKFVLLFLCFWKQRYSADKTFPKVLIMRKGTQGSVQEQMFHNRRTLQEITQIREDNIDDNVMTLCSLILI
jgi:hypothetical protein